MTEWWRQCPVSEMTYTVSSGTLNFSIPYHEGNELTPYWPVWLSPDLYMPLMAVGRASGHICFSQTLLTFCSQVQVVCIQYLPRQASHSSYVVVSMAVTNSIWLNTDSSCSPISFGMLDALQKPLATTKSMKLTKHFAPQQSVVVFTVRRYA